MQCKPRERESSYLPVTCGVWPRPLVQRCNYLLVTGMWEFLLHEIRTSSDGHLSYRVTSGQTWEKRHLALQCRSSKEEESPFLLRETLKGFSVMLLSPAGSLMVYLRLVFQGGLVLLQ